MGDETDTLALSGTAPPALATPQAQRPIEDPLLAYLGSL